MERVKYYMHTIAENTLAGTGTGAVLDDVLRAPGKMVRPKLLLLCSAFGSHAEEKRERLSMLAAMVELTHMASLIHDDIIDEAPCRRGAPSIQKKYGKDAAVYAGDFLIERVHYWQVKERFLDAALLLSRTVEAMCVGEIGQATCRYATNVTVENYLENIRGKTASLFRTACQLGAIETGCDALTTEKLGCFGEYLGILFQFRDDLLDFTSSAAREGKDVHKDFHDGIYTLPVLMTLKEQEGRESLLPLMEKNREHTLSAEEIARMEREVVRCGGVARTEGEIHRYAAMARTLLGTLPDIPEARKIGRMLDKLEAI